MWELRKWRLAESDVGVQAESTANRRVTQRGVQGRGPVHAIIGGQQEPLATYGPGKRGGAELRPSQAGAYEDGTVWSARPQPTG